MSWNIPPIFALIQQTGSITDEEMYRVFNMGVGMVLICARQCVDPVLAMLHEAGITAGIIGEIMRGDRSVEIG